MYISLDDVEDTFEAILVATGEKRSRELSEVCSLLGMTTRDDIGGDEDGK